MTLTPNHIQTTFKHLGKPQRNTKTSLNTCLQKIKKRTFFLLPGTFLQISLSPCGL